LRTLKKIFALKQCTLEEFISKTNSPLDISQVLDSLVTKNYIHKQGDVYKIREDVVLAQLSRYATFEKIQYKAVPADQVEQKKVRLDSFKSRLSKFTDVRDIRECYIVAYV
jgi:hypothetical protein